MLLLKNMVAPGDVDDDLSRETHLVRGPQRELSQRSNASFTRYLGYTQECEKYGAVKQCVIFEVTERSVAPEEAVRTFVAFEKQVLVRTPCTCALFCNATLAPSTGERSEGISRSRGSFFRWSENLVRVL